MKKLIHIFQKTILKWTGIPVSIGVGPTKTLAKIAQYGAKKYGGTGVFCLHESLQIEHVLKHLPINEIWGIGRNLSRRLNDLNIYSSYDLMKMDTRLIRSKFSVVLERTVRELRGEQCLAVQNDREPKKQIIVSRSFRERTGDFNQLKPLISNFAVRASEKLRRENQYCKMISVFMRTNYFRKQDKQYSGMLSCKLSTPTNDTRDILHAAKLLSQRIYKEDLNFIKAGVLLSDFYDEGVCQSDFFTPHKEREGSKDLMTTIDKINRSGIGKITFAAQGIEKSWSMKRDFQSPRYSTNWSELLVVR